MKEGREKSGNYVFQIKRSKKSANMRKYDFPAITANASNELPKAMNGHGMILFLSCESFWALMK